MYLFKGNQSDASFLSHVGQKIAPNGIYIVINGAFHIGNLTKITFWHLFENHLKPLSLYVIADWGTGYWDDWPDGKKMDCVSLNRAVAKPQSFATKILRKLRLNNQFPSHQY